MLLDWEQRSTKENKHRYQFRGKAEYGSNYLNKQFDDKFITIKETEPTQPVEPKELEKKDSSTIETKKEEPKNKKDRINSVNRQLKEISFA